jgi:glutamine phosphoribosylpyrophosphate amidotransferase
MCGVIGYYSPELTITDKLYITKLFLESSVRGLHAFGIAWGTLGEPLEVYRSLSIKQVVEKVMEVRVRGTAVIIGHCRYSTSGDWQNIDNNQPLVDRANNLLVFNGVISMKKKEEFEEEYGRKFSVDNDGEIMLWKLSEGTEAAISLLKRPEVSYAGCHYVNRRFTAFRNENRPLHQLKVGISTFIVSTEDIFRRTFFPSVADKQTEIPPYEIIQYG